MSLNTSIGMEPKLTQTQTLSPQMRYSLEVLQSPAQDLRAIVQAELEQNPAIEEVSADTKSIEAEREEFMRANNFSDSEYKANEEARDKASPSDGEDASASSESELDFDREFEVLSDLGDDMEEYLFQDGGNNEYNPDLEEKRQFAYDSITEQPSLQEHLLDQLELSDIEKDDIPIAEEIIGSINDDGYLATPLADVAQVQKTNIERVEIVLSMIQDFTPSGVAARDLRECLLIQISQSQLEGTLAETLVSDYLELVSANNISQIAKKCGADISEVEDAIHVITRLNPKPGTSFQPSVTMYVIPEIEVRNVDGHYKVFLEDIDIPHIKVSNKYRRILDSPNETDDTKQYVRDKIRAGEFLIKSIEQRQNTIQRVAQAIVDSQHEFFDNGVSSLKPLTMSDIATGLGIHETTVSRTVSNKYMRSPQGIHELRFFFTGGIHTQSGDLVSNELVKSLLRKMVDEEDSASPLSDLDIEKAFKDKGISVARRTIAKYRGMLKILPSHMRKR